MRLVYISSSIVYSLQAAELDHNVAKAEEMAALAELAAVEAVPLL